MLLPVQEALHPILLGIIINRVLKMGGSQKMLATSLE